MSLDLNLLKIILAVHDCGSVGTAAHVLGMSQPGLSTALHRARVTLKDPLFVRGSRGMEPTTRTRSIVDPIRKILDSVDQEIVNPVDFDPRSYCGEMRIALTDAGEATLLPTLIGCLTRHCPHATIRSLSYGLAELERSLEAGAIDLALGYFPDLSTAGYHEQFISSHSYLCLVAADHRLHGTITREDFLACGHIAVETQARNEELLDEYMRRQRMSRRIVARIPHFMSIPAIISHTDLIATVPEGVATSANLTDAVRVVRPDFVMPKFQSKLYWHSSAHHDSRNRWLRRTLFAELRARAATLKTDREAAAA